MSVPDHARALAADFVEQKLGQAAGYDIVFFFGKREPDVDHLLQIGETCLGGFHDLFVVGKSDGNGEV